MTLEKQHLEEIAEELVLKAEKKAIIVLSEAEKKAQQLLYDANLDINKVNLICNKIIKIQVDLAWIKWVVMGTMAGVGGLFFLVLSKTLIK